MKSELQEARSLLFNQTFGVLSTISEEFDRYPFGSLTPYSLNQLGEPVILIASIAQHTINIKADSRVSLMIMEDGDENIQARARLTVMADAEKTEDEDATERYLRRFPHSRHYHKEHSFGFYRLKPVRIRYIGGFGKIHWIESLSYEPTA